MSKIREMIDDLANVIFVYENGLCSMPVDREVWKFFSEFDAEYIIYRFTI